MDMNAFLHFFDIIDKVDGLRGDLMSMARRKGGGCAIEFLPLAGSSGADIEHMLNHYGIGVWGRGITRSNADDPAMAPEWCLLHVRQSQAEWARYLIARRGCRLSGRTPRTAPVGMPVAWADKLRGAKPTTPQASSTARKTGIAGWLGL